MKYYKFQTMRNLITIIIFICLAVQIKAQGSRSGVLEINEQTVGLSAGMDYSMLSAGITYIRGVNVCNYKYPVTIGGSISVPVFNFDFSDAGFKVISETTIHRKKNFEIRGGVNPALILLKTKTTKMTSIGTDFHVFSGFINNKWNCGLELTYNQIFSTYIKHTDIYKESVFENVADGWYKMTAANIKIGILIKRTINRYDIFLNGGITKTGRFNDYIYVPPIYTVIGMNYRF